MRTCVILLLISLSFIVNAQQSEGGRPYSIDLELLKSGSLKSSSNLNQQFLEPVDNDKERFITDSLNYTTSIKTAYYGKLLKLDIDIKNDIDPIKVEGGNLYLHHIFSTSAYGIQFFFDRFYIPKGGKLFVYNEEKDMILGAFTEKNNNQFKHFGTQYIKGNSVIIEYFEPDYMSDNSMAELHIDRVSHVFKPVFAEADLWGAAGNCHVDIACETDQQWQELAGSVALILCVKPEANYSYWCTGVLLNNTNNDGRPLLLSASHCADSTRNKYEGYEFERFDYTRWIFLFNYQKENCGDQKAKEYNHSVYGSKILSIDDHTAFQWYTDHLLLELETTPKVLEKYNAVYAGWDANEDIALQTIYAKSIHHPAGDSKKISTAGGGVESGAANAWPDSEWEVTWTEGVTDFGSSGAPLFNDNFKVIGQLYGGGSMCSNTLAPDYFSKLSISYDYGNLQKWLDPANLNSRSANKLDPTDVVLIEKENIQFTYNFESGDASIFIFEGMNTGSKVFVRFVEISTGRMAYSNVFDGNNKIDFRFKLSSGIYIMSIDYNFKSETRKIFISDF